MTSHFKFMVRPFKFMTSAVFQGTYCDLRFIKTRSVAQIVIEIPIEAASAFVAAFGAPAPGAECPVAIARIDPASGKGVMPTERNSARPNPIDVRPSEQSEPAGAEPSGRAIGGYARAAALTPERRQEIGKAGAEARWKEPRKFSSLPLPQQAALRCNDPLFWNFIHTVHRHEVYSADEAAEFVRSYCGVNSRSQLGSESSGRLWHQLNANYEAWLHAPESGAA